MPNPYRKLSAGAMVTEMSRTVYNDAIDMLNWWKTNYGRHGGKSQKNLVDWDQTVFYVDNQTGNDLDEYDVIGIYGPLYTPTENLASFKAKTPLKGVLPTTAYSGKFGVVLEANKYGSGIVVKTCLSGVVPVRVYVNKIKDKFVDVIAAKTVGSKTTYLGSGDRGAQILWWEATSSSNEGTIVWALIRLGAVPGPRFYNASGETVPAYAMMAVTGVQTLDDGSIIPKIEKPSTTFYHNYLVNGSVSVPVEDDTTMPPTTGIGNYQDSDDVKIWYYGTAPALGDELGPAPGYWYLTKDYLPVFTTYGAIDTTNRVAIGRFHELGMFIGKLDAALSVGSSATVSIYTRRGSSFSDTTFNIIAYDWLGYASIPTGKKVVCQKIGGIYVVIEAECGT